MADKISPRLSAIVDALPIKAGMRILEIGCGPGVASREIVRRFSNTYVLGIDRSASAIQKARSNSQNEMRPGNLEYRVAAIEDFELEKADKPFDLAFAVRVGVLDGRHPEIEELAFLKIKKALVKNGRCFIDGGNPLKELTLSKTK